MRMIAVVVLAGVLTLGALASAQDELQPVVVSKPTYTGEVARMRISGIPAACRLGDRGAHPVTTSVAVGDRIYRCVTVLDEKLEPVGAAWTRVVP